jgi:hypothetical protein
MQQQHHVFISHSSDDREEANFVATYLEQRGARIWIAPRDVRPGRDYSEQLQQAIEDCGAFVVLVTGRSNKSPYVRVETEMAFSLEKPIFPVRTSDVAPGPGLALFLKIKHWTDAFGAAREQNLARLAEEVKYVIGQNDSAEPETVAQATSGGSDVSKSAEPGIPKASGETANIPAQKALLGKGKVPRSAIIGILAGVALLGLLLFAALRTSNVPVQSAAAPQGNGSAPTAAPPAAGTSNTTPSVSSGGTMQNFTFRNASAVIVTHLFVSPVTSGDWGSDVLGESVLQPGQAVQVPLPSSDGQCNWDLMLRVENGTVHEMRNTDLCRTNQVTYQ